MHIFNLKRSALDGTERKFNHAKYLAVAMPTMFDLRPRCPAVYDQGNEGSCTANAGCAARVMLEWSTTLELSRAFQYYMERLLEGTTDEDSGASMKDIGVALQDYGVCLDSLMPYVVGNYATPPTEADKQAAVKYKISNASLVSANVKAIQSALVTRNQPVLCGMTVYESMESAQTEKTGVLPMPRRDEQVLGGHAVLVVGYLPKLPDSALAKFHPFLRDLYDGTPENDGCIEKLIEELAEFFTRNHSAGYLIVRNSWGSGWGDGGYFYMPYEYVDKQYANEFWILNK